MHTVSRAILLALLAFAFGGVKAAKQIQNEVSTRHEETLQATVQPLLSSPILHTGSTNVIFKASFTKCVTAINPNMFVVIPSTINGERAAFVNLVEPVEDSEDQVWNVNIRFVSELMVNGVTDFDVYFPAGMVTEISSNGNVPNVDSNILHFHFYLPLEVTFSTNSPDPSPTQRVHFDVTFNQPVHALEDAPLTFLGTDQGYPYNGAESVEYVDDKTWKVTTYTRNNERFIVQLVAGAAINDAGMTSPPSRPVSIGIEKQTGECAWDQWSEWSACSLSCAYFDARFNRRQGDRTRTRVQTDGPPGECGPSSEFGLCNTQLCESDGRVSGSRPFSGEFGFECFNDCNTGAQLSGCSCDAQCDADDDCCQSYYSAGCMNDPSKVYRAGDFPLQCGSTTQCSSLAPQQSRSQSYFCYCDPGCGDVNGVDMCCGGQSSRDTFCGSAIVFCCFLPSEACGQASASQCLQFGGTVVDSCAECQNP